MRNQTWHWQSVADTTTVFEHYMNRYGFRDEEWFVKRKPGKQRIIFVGDSFVEGVMAEQDETITAGFKNAAGQKYEVFNCGIVGVGLVSYLQLVADIIPIYQPDVVFFCIYANDLGEKEPVIPRFYLSPEYFDWYKPRLFELLNQMLTNGPILFRWHSDSKPYLAACPSEANPWTNHHDELQPHVSPWLAEAMKKGTFNPFRTNSLFKEEHFLKLSPRLGETILFLKFICTKYKVTPVIVYIPTRNQLTKYYYQFERELCQVKCPEPIDLTIEKYQLHQRVIARQCKAQNIPFINLIEIIREREAKGEHLYWNYEEHMKAKGYLLLGKAIWNEWQSRLGS